MKLILIIALLSFIGYDAIDSHLSSKKDLRFKIKLIDTQTVHQGQVTASAVLTSGLSVTGSEDGTVLIWDEDELKDVFESDQNSAVTALLALPNNTLAIGYENGGIVLASFRNDGSFSINMFTNSMHIDKLNAFAFEIKSQMLISCSQLTCNSWSLLDGKLISSDYFGDQLGAQFIILLENKNIIRYVNSNVTILKPNRPDYSINCIATAISVIPFKDVRLDGILVIASQQTPIILIDITTLRELKRPVVKVSSSVTSLLSLPNGHLLSGHEDGSISIWSLFDNSEPIQTINDQSDAISSLTVLNNGNLISTSLDGTVNIYSIVDTRLVGQLYGPTFALISDELIAIGGVEFKTIEIKNLTDGTLVKTLFYNGKSLSQVVSLLLLQNGDLLSCSLGGEIRIWDLEKYEDKNVTFKKSFPFPHAFVQLENGNLVSIIQIPSMPSSFYISDVNTGELLRQVDLNTIYDMNFGIKLLSENRVIFALAFGKAASVLDLADNSSAIIGETKGPFTYVLPLKYKKLVALVANHQLVFYKSDTFELYKEINISGFLITVTSLVETSEGYLLAAFNDGSIKVVDIQLGTLSQPFTAHRLPISSLALLDNKNIVSLSRQENSIKIWKSKFDDGFNKRSVTVDVRVNAFCQVGEDHLVIGSFENIISVLELSSMSVVRSFNVLGSKSQVTALLALSKGYFLIGKSDGGIVLAHIESDSINTTRCHKMSVTSLISVGDYIISGSIDGTVKRWSLRLATGVLIQSAILVESKSPINGLTFSAVDNNLVSIHRDGSFSVLNLNEQSEIKAQNVPVMNVALMSVTNLPGSLLAFGLINGLVLIYDLKAKLVTNELNRHTTRVNSLVFLNNGLLASASADKSMVFWNYQKGLDVNFFKDHSETITSLMLFGKNTLVSASHDKTVNFYSIDE